MTALGKETIAQQIKGLEEIGNGDELNRDILIKIVN